MERDLEETLFIIITKVLFHICFSNRGITSASLFFSLQSKEKEGGMSEIPLQLFLSWTTMQVNPAFLLPLLSLQSKYASCL